MKEEEARLLIHALTSHSRESTKLDGDFALYKPSIIMMLVTNLLMIEDRCSISFAQKMFAMYIISIIIVMKSGAKQTR